MVRHSYGLMKQGMIKVTPAEASEYMAKGYTVECYLVLPNPSVLKAQKRKQSPQIPKNSVLCYSVSGSPPVNGEVSRAWENLRLWAFNDPTTTKTRIQVETRLITEKFKYPGNYVSQLIHHYKVLRVVKSGN